ncbi:TIGR02270 family protein [Myxococcus virescens]|uniref:TIGR02270 family protein n=1 Tax=Myxococcus virescens TaxID=83456 RepID=UPI003DA2BBE4
MVLLDVLEEHLNEAAFQWEQWERALVAPDFTMEETAAVEERLRAHLEGVEDESAVEAVLWPAFESEELPLIFAAAYALLTLGEVDEVLLRFRRAEPEARTVIRRALELSEAPGLSAPLSGLLKLDDLDVQVHALETLAFRKDTSPEVLTRFLVHEEPRARVAALRGALPLQEETVRRLLPPLLDSSSPDIRAIAVEAGLMSGVGLAWDTCRKVVRSRSTLSPEPLVLIAMGGDDDDISLLVDLAETAELRPMVLWALGFSGRLAAMEACVKYLAEPSVAQVAGEAFSAMTGLRLDGPYALPPGKRPEGAPLPPDLQEDLDANLVPSPEDNLPWPQVAAITLWWKGARSRFEKGKRYLLGQPFSVPLLIDALETSPMRRRHVLARELAIRTRGQHVIPTRAFALRQRESLSRARSTSVSLKGSPFTHTAR